MTASGMEGGPLPCGAVEVDGSWFGHLAQTEKPRLGEGSGAVKALPDFAPPPAHRDPGSTSTAPLMNARPPFRAKFVAILRGAMTFRVRHSPLQLAGVLHGIRFRARSAPAAPLRIINLC
jgi:hypothetical protein